MRYIIHLRILNMIMKIAGLSDPFVKKMIQDVDQSDRVG